LHAIWTVVIVKPEIASERQQRGDDQMAQISWNRSAALSSVALATIFAAQPAMAQVAQGKPDPQSTPGETAPAAPAADPAAEQYGDIVVTANKRAENLLSVPVSVTAVSGDQLVNKGIYSVQDLVKVTPGLSYVESGRSIPVFSLRGVGYFDQSIAARPTVSVYVDEAPIPFPVEAKGAAFDLQRVEVLKGPQGTLFGQNATGGAINYIAAKPTSTLTAGATASFGRFDTFDGQAYVSGPLTDTLRARVAVRGVRSGDWQRSYTRDDTIGAQRFLQGRVLLDWKPTDNLTVSLNVNGWHDGSDTQAPQYRAFVPGSPSRVAVVPNLISYPIAPENGRAADWNPGTPYRADNDFWQASLRADYVTSGGVTLTSLSSYSWAKINQLAEGDGTSLMNLDALLTGRLKSFSQELRAAGDIGPVSFIAGLNYEADDTRQAQGIDITYSSTAYSVGAPPALPLDKISSELNQHFDTYAAFLNLDYHISDTITLRGGARYTIADLRYDACSVGLSANAADAFTRLVNRTRANLGLTPIGPLAIGQCSSINPSGATDRYFSSFNQDNVSWRAGIDWKPRPGTLIYASVSKGYKAGSGSTPAATNALQFAPVNQESVLAYEVGAKASLFDRHVEVTAAAFYYDYRNKQVLGRAVYEPNVFGALNALTNVPKSEVKGAEAQITVFPIRGLTLTAAGTYLDTRVLGNFANVDILGNPINFRHNAFPYTPKWQIVLDGEYKLPIAERTQLIFGANANYRTKTTAGFGGNSILDIDPYWLVDLRAGVDLADGKYRIQVYGRNVTNQYYWTNVSRSVDNARRYTGMPATYGVQLSVKY
jgi:iron complex outermembrane receptor protein